MSQNLLDVAQSGDTTTVRELLAAGADVEARDADGFTPPQRATRTDGPCCCSLRGAGLLRSLFRSPLSAEQA